MLIKSLVKGSFPKLVRHMLTATVVIGCIGFFILPTAAVADDGFTVGGRIVTKAKSAARIAAADAKVLDHTQVMLFAVPEAKIVAKTVPAEDGSFSFDQVPPGRYLIQVLAPDYIVSKTKITVGKALEAENRQIEIILVRPIDPGVGTRLEDGLYEITARAASAGVDHAFGCISISLVFVQWEDSNTWNDTLRNDSIAAAQASMSALESIAPPGANISTVVENFGTYTVSKDNPVGCWCADADLWVDEILTDAGYTSGSLDDRLTQLSSDRSEALCGTDPTCGECGVDSSNFLFFITRDDCGDWGGWNCNNRYLISYWNRYDESVVYLHEVGHGFGASDEYCVPNQNYCCGWFLTSPWGCDQTGGCLNAYNDNCDPACGAACGTNGDGDPIDCQDGCPDDNCINHTACAMDGSGTLSFCASTRRQIGWVDSDGDLALDCLETACGTNPNDSGDFPACVNMPPTSNPGGPYEADCAGSSTSVALDGTGSSDPEGDPLTYAWTTTCPGGAFDDPSAPAPVLTIDTSNFQCPGLTCSVELSVSDSMGLSDMAIQTVSVRDVTVPVLSLPPDITIECDQSTAPQNTGTATAVDACDPTPAITFSDSVLPGACPNEWTINRTWVATDACGNTRFDVQTIHVVDTTPPVLSGVPGDVTVECDAVPAPAAVTVADNCDPDPSLVYTETRTDGDCPSNYVLTRTWSSTDACGNSSSATQIITVVDTTAPVIAFNAPATMIPPDAPISFTATATDNCDPDPDIALTGYDCYALTKKGKWIDKKDSCVVSIENDTITILDSGGVDTHITWDGRAVDNCGNVSENTFKIVVLNPVQ